MVDVRSRKLADYFQQELCSGNALAELTHSPSKQILHSHDTPIGNCVSQATGRCKGRPVSDWTFPVVAAHRIRDTFVRYGRSR